MIVLIAPENDIPNEIEILNQLFQEGLQYYHFRKPNKSYEQHCEYLNQVDEKYHNRIVVHFFHELINDYNLKGIHFQEQKRKDHINNIEHYFEGLNMTGKTVSSSFHELTELEACPIEFDYHLLSPVFSSISKQDYQGRDFDVNHIDKVIIGMGGVVPNNLAAFIKLGFNGVGVLGGIWNNSDPITNFKAMKNYFDQLKSGPH